MVIWDCLLQTLNRLDSFQLISTFAQTEVIPEDERAKLWMSLLGIVLCGIFLIFLVTVGARWVRNNISDPKNDSQNDSNAK